MIRQKIYISGKISNLPKETYTYSFAEAEETLRKTYPFALVKNPIKITSHLRVEIHSWKQYMVCNIEELLDCDTIYMLKNWKDSRGSRVEHAIALELEMTILYQL